MDPSHETKPPRSELDERSANGSKGAAPRAAAGVGVWVAAGADPARTVRTLRALARSTTPDLRVAVARPAEAPPLPLPPGLRVHALARSQCPDPIHALGLSPGEPLALVEDGCMPPPNWCEALLAHQGAVVPGIRPAWIAAESVIAGASSPDDVALEAQLSVAQKLRGVHEHVAFATGPLLLTSDGPAWAVELGSWWSLGGTGELELPHTARVLQARDVVATRDPAAQSPLCAGVRDPLLPRDPVLQAGPARALRTRLAGALAVGPRPAAALFLAELCLRMGHLSQARSAAHTGLEHWPRSVDLTLCLGEAEAHGGFESRARARLEELVARTVLSPRRRARLLATLGETWRALGDCDQAEPCFDSALALQPELPTARIGRGRMRLECGDFEGALDDLRCAVMKDPLHTLGWYHLGRTLAVCGESLRAREALSRALEVHADHREAADLQKRLHGAPAVAVAAH